MTARHRGTRKEGAAVTVAVWWAHERAAMLRERAELALLRGGGPRWPWPTTDPDADAQCSASP